MLVLPALAALIAGVAEEAYQWFLPARVGELRDVWLNGVAILCGVLASNALAPPAAFAGWTRDATRRTCRMLAVAVVALAAFVHVVHLGVDIRDGDVSFASRYSAEDLTRIPTIGAHAGAPIRHWLGPPACRAKTSSSPKACSTCRPATRRGRPAMSCVRRAQNGILERHFAVVLDTPSYVARQGHRWLPAQRADAEARVQAAPRAPFTSEAYPYPIFTWPPLALWGVALGAAAGLRWLGRSARW